jgi:hypothetical protein
MRRELKLGGCMASLKVTYGGFYERARAYNPDPASNVSTEDEIIAI